LNPEQLGEDGHGYKRAAETDQAVGETSEERGDEDQEQLHWGVL
jgi:hypothetical protein